MAEVCRATLGDNAFLFWEQFVVKGPERGMKFGWHQDSGYLNFPHRPYITCWCALDDVDESNGTIYVLPWSRPGAAKHRLEHTREAGSNDLVGYHGDDPGVPVIAPAGTVAVFSSLTFHRSGANTTPRMRRAYTAHYSDSPILNPDGTLCAFADPIVREGQYVPPTQGR
jgi:ectoine hydroxylase-related dioxygenase (phytanoyl-CoA dioxygenase family)